MLNYHRNDTDKFLKLQRIFQERWKKDNQDSSYRSDNDIFNTNGGRTLRDGTFYRAEAKRIVEENIDRSFRVFILNNNF
jgi:hypothetical protein